MALGFTQVSVARRPQVGILSSGDEVVPPEVKLGPGQRPGCQLLQPWGAD